MATAADRRGRGPERAFARPLPRPATGVVRLDDEEARHLVRVRRVRVGDPVVLFDGEGRAVRGHLARADAGATEVAVEGEETPRRPRRRVVVATAWPDGARADELVATLAELGVEAVVPLRTARANPEGGERAARRAERHARLAREAAKVNGHARCLVVAPAQELATLLAGAADGTRVLLDTDPAAPPMTEVVRGVTGEVVLLVGPEGGFTDAEVAAAQAAGARVASVGGCALRTETAAVAAAAVALAG